MVIACTHTRKTKTKYDVGVQQLTEISQWVFHLLQILSADQVVCVCVCVCACVCTCMRACMWDWERESTSHIGEQMSRFHTISASNCLVQSGSHFKVLQEWFCYQLICEMAQWIPVQVPIIMRFLLLLLLLLSHHLCQPQMYCSHTAHPSIPTCSHSPAHSAWRPCPPQVHRRWSQIVGGLPDPKQTINCCGAK